MQKKWNTLWIIFLVLIFIGLIYLLSPILTPFLIGALLAYLVNPLVHRLMRFRIPRIVCVIIVFVSLFFILSCIVLILTPLIQKQINTFTTMIPNFIKWVQSTTIPWISDFLESQPFIDIDTLKENIATQWTKAGNLASVFLHTLIRSGFFLFDLFMNVILIPVVTFYLLCDWDKLIKGIRHLIPRHMEPVTVHLVKECDSVLSAFFRGQLLVMVSLATIYSIALSAAGLGIGLILGLLIGLISIVPYLGTILGVVIASTAAFIQYGDMDHVFVIWGIFMIVQLIENTILTPRLIGNRIGLHPVAVIFAILAGGTLFGFFGILLALPVAAIIMVGLRFLHHHYHESALYK